MPSRWQLFEIPHKSRRGRGISGFLGENNTDAKTDAVYGYGFYRLLRNYQLGRQGATKRQGIRAYRGGGARLANGTVASLGIREFLGARQLVASCGVGLYQLDDGAWSDISGSMSLTADRPVRFTSFHNGVTGYLIGTNGVDEPFKWDGSGDIEALSSNGEPSFARDVAEYQGRVWALNTNAGPTALEYSNDGDESTWDNGNVLHPSRRSEGVALEVFGNREDGALLAFYDNSIHAVRFHYSDATSFPFVTDPVDDSHGAISQAGIVKHRGSIFFVDRDGIYEINNLNRRAKLVSRPIEKLWGELNPSRIQDIHGFGFGTKGEICWLATKRISSKHDTALIYNTEVAERFGKEAGWTVLEINSTSLRPAAGISWEDEDSEVITLLGNSDGKVYEAWGDEDYFTGTVDNGQPIQSRIRCGFLDLGVPGYEKGLRAFSVDALIPPEEREFDIEIYGEEERLAFLDQVTKVGQASGSRFDEFQFDVSSFASEPDPIEISLSDINGSARYFEATVTERSRHEPHSILGLRWWFVRERQVD